MKQKIVLINENVANTPMLQTKCCEQANVVNKMLPRGYCFQIKCCVENIVVENVAKENIVAKRTLLKKMLQMEYFEENMLLLQFFSSKTSRKNIFILEIMFSNPGQTLWFHILKCYSIHCTSEELVVYLFLI